jgi:phosphate transport system substrate-binding protein
MKLSKKFGIVAVISGLIISVAPSAFAVDLQGQGASFPALLIESCKVPFAKTSGHTLTYNPNGSGAGKTASDNQTGNVWFSDSPNLNTTARKTLVHIPAVAAPIAILHNLPGRAQLYLSPETAAKIFSGDITRWNDPLIQADNNRSITEVIYKKDRKGDVVKDSAGKPVVLRNTTKNAIYTLPDQAIQVVFRADKSGTSANFTKWLNGVAPKVWTKPSNDLFSTSFPTNINSSANIGRIVGANYSAGVSQMAASRKYSITYAESSYGEKYKLKTVALGNASGNFILPTAAATGAFLASSTVGATGFFTFDYATKEPGAYTLGIVSYMLGDSDYKDKASVAATKAWANFIISKDCTDLGKNDAFIPIEGNLLKIAAAAIAKLG